MTVTRVLTPMMVLMRCCNSLPMVWISGRPQLAGNFALDFAADFQVVEVAVAGDDDLVVPGQALVAQDLLLDLGREDIDAADDQHVVGAAGDLADAAEGAGGRGSRRVRSRVR